MKSIFWILILQSLLLLSGSVIAGIITAPSVNRNVHVIQNTTPSGCPRSWNGEIGPEEVSEATGYGMQSGTAVGVQSCTGCAFDSKSHDCVCNRCYGYYN